MIWNVTIIMVINKELKPVKKIISAIFSYLSALLEVLRIDKNENKLLLINIIVAKEVHSSINVVLSNLKIFIDVKTKKQIPRRFAEVFKMCGDFVFF